MVCREGVNRTPECQVCRILGWAATGQPCGGRAVGGCAWRWRPSDERRAQAATDLRPGLAGSGVARLCTICQARAAKDDDRAQCAGSWWEHFYQNKASDCAGGDEKQEAATGGGYEEGDGEEAWLAASFGQYGTWVELPENMDMDKIGAEVRDGVLYLTIPKLTAGGEVVNIQVQ
ncbi:unnamed protein product [Miscanthus lutarioriparius]|uniref:SHSP domain-containing protein n=1 Tax=Miscanthus lutarioriparius TaxID=422564 RepID=A0A811NER5_9POAL|nr:unnamed protein product [Miscanthus lutarioriparius]